MLKLKVALFTISIVYICLINTCASKPLKAKDMKNSQTKFFNVLGKRNIKDCSEIMGDKNLEKFTSEVAIAFFSSGDVESLDNLLKTLVGMNCFKLSETKAFRNELITVYQLIKNIDNNELDAEKHSDKRANHVDYYHEINALIDELLEAYHKGNKKSLGLLRYMVEYIYLLEDTNELSVNETLVLLNKIKSASKLEETGAETMDDDENMEDDSKAALIKKD